MNSRPDFEQNAGQERARETGFEAGRAGGGRSQSIGQPTAEETARPTPEGNVRLEINSHLSVTGSVCGVASSHCKVASNGR